MTAHTRTIAALLFGVGLAGCGQRPHEPVANPPAALLMASDDQQQRRPLGEFDARPEEILDLVIQDLLTSPDPLRKSIRDDSGLRGTRIGLSRNSGAAWPTKYMPRVQGFQFEYVDPDRDRKGESPELGIELVHFVFPPPAKAPKHEWSGYPIVLFVFNIGGRAPTVDDNGAYMYYDLQHTESRWAVKFGGLEAQ
jgi:hypothetical protein